MKLKRGRKKGKKGGRRKKRQKKRKSKKSAKSIDPKERSVTYEPVVVVLRKKKGRRWAKKPPPPPALFERRRRRGTRRRRRRRPRRVLGRRCGVSFFFSSFFLSFSLSLSGGNVRCLFGLSIFSSVGRHAFSCRVCVCVQRTDLEDVRDFRVLVRAITQGRKKNATTHNNKKNGKNKGGDEDNNNNVSSDTEESTSIDEEDVEFVTKNALFTKRLLANSKDLEEGDKGKNNKNKNKINTDDEDGGERVKKNDNDDDDDNVERMFFEQEKVKKKEAWEKKQQEILKKKKKKEERDDDDDDDDDNDDDDEDDEGNASLLLPVKRLDGTLVKKPALKDTQATVKAKRGEAQEFEAFQNIEDENGNNSSRNSRKKSLDDEDLGLEKAKNETKRRKKDVSEEDTSAKKKKKKANWWEEEEAKEKSTLGEDSKDNNNNNDDDDDDASDDQMENEDVDFTFSAKKYLVDPTGRRFACRQFIAELCQKAIEQPETNIKDAAKLIKTLCDDPHSKEVAQDACASMTLLLLDILPDYRLRELSVDKNELEGLSDKVKKQRKEEDLLCKTYKSFLRLLTKNAKKGVNSIVSGPSPSVSGKCLIQFLLKKPNSNYRGEILRAIISSAFTSSDVTIAEGASKAFSEICRADENGDLTLEILQLMAELVKKNMKSIWPQSIAWFKSINLNAAVSALKPEEERFQKMSRKQERKERAGERELSRKQRAKMAKALQEQNRMKPFTGDTGANKEDDESDSDDKSFKRRLEKSIKKDLAEAEGGKTKSWKEKIKIQSKMIEAVFEVYVRVLKRATDDIEDSVGATNNSDSSDESDTDSDYDKAVIVNQRRHMHQNRKRGTFALIAPTLENLPNISRLIDVDYMADLSSLFTKALSSKRFTIADKCRVVLCLVDSFAGGGIESALADVDLSSTRNKVFSEILCLNKYKATNDCMEFLKSLSLPQPPDNDDEDSQNRFDHTYDEFEAKAKGSLRVDAVAAFLNSQTLGETISASTQRVASQAFGAMNTPTAMAFIKKITNVSVETVESGEAFGLLLTMADCLRRAPKTRDILDFTKERKFAPSTAGGGFSNRNNHSSKKTKKKSSTLNRFNSDSVNPEKANGGVATAWELFLLKDHFNPVVAGAATAVLNYEFDDIFQFAHKMSRKDVSPTSPKRKITERGINEEENDGESKGKFSLFSKARTAAGSCARVASTLSGGFHPEVPLITKNGGTVAVSAKKRKSCAEGLSKFEEKLNSFYVN